MEILEWLKRLAVKVFLWKVEAIKIITWALRLCWNILTAKERVKDDDRRDSAPDHRSQRLGPLQRFIWRLTVGENCNIVRKMGKLEDFMATGTEFGNYFIVYKLLLHTKSQLEPEHVRQALQIMQRKFGILRVGVTKFLGNRYFTRLDNPKPLFEVIESDHWERTYEEMLQCRYSSDGPQWQAKMFTMPFYNKQTTFQQRDFEDADSAIDTDESRSSPEGSVDGDHEDKDSGVADSSSVGSDDERIDDVRSDDDQDNYPYRTTLLFGFNHAITDGTTNIKLFKNFLDILNSVIDEKPMAATPTVELMPAAHDLLPRSMYKLRSKDRSPLVEFLIEVLFPKKRTYSLNFPPPLKPVYQTKAIFMSLSEEETSLLVNKCRQQKVTVHCAITAAGTIAMQEFIQKKSPGLNNFEVRSTHIVNLRKHCSDKDYYGCNFTFYRLGVEVPQDGRDGFWKIATQLKSLLKDDEKIICSDRIYHQMMLPQVFYWNNQRSSECISDFGTSNLGDCTRIFPGTGRHAEVSRLMRSISVHNMGTAYVHVVSTFRGRLMYNMDYCLNYTTDERANEYAQLTLDVLKEKIFGKRLSPLKLKQL